jgi:hypothetical protein
MTITLIVFLWLSSMIFLGEKHRELVTGQISQLTDHDQPEFVNCRRVKALRYDDGFAVTGWDNEVGIRVWWGSEENHLFEVHSGLEWAFVIRNRPATGLFVFPMLSRKLHFARQGELTPSERKNGHQRPDSVVDSYAVFHSGRKNNVRYADGTIDAYGTGKFTHIFRPYAFDASGDTVWCDMIIADDWLVLMISENWLAEAVLPVIVDPIFGMSTVGGSSEGTSIDRRSGTRETMGAVPGTTDSLTVHVNQDGTDPGNLWGMLYDDNSGCSSLIDTIADDQEYNVGVWETRWVSMALTGVNLTAQADYWPMVWCDSFNIKITYDQIAGYEREFWDMTSWPPATNCGTGYWTSVARRATYITYSEVTNGEKSNRRRAILNSNRSY